MTSVRTSSGHELPMSNDLVHTAETACTVAGINPVTLRSWRNRGWFKPQIEKPAGQWTLYSFRDLCLLRCAGMLTTMGIPGNVALTISKEICQEHHLKEAESRCDTASRTPRVLPYCCEVAALFRLDPQLQVTVKVEYKRSDIAWRPDRTIFSDGQLSNGGRPQIILDVTFLVYHTAAALKALGTETQQ